MYMYHVISWGLTISNNENPLSTKVMEYFFLIPRIGIKASVVMIPLLGVTWLFGLLSPVHKAFAYIFTILNSAQGFLIFTLHCVRNTQIKERFKRKMNIVFPSSIRNNYSRKSSQLNPSEVGDIWAVELKSFAKFESKSHLT
ncbi:hypothetical protein pdam_00025494 [Pocillopora damicornis]|uniref:G-protein coupled receptors family 2 profile 2 domain-containing protein n=1 Tax=Pocillopora damicornis TaxID=46731 RepID=A0A3M6T7R9_POCDA|nr:hypothetical protein pdam_00025494 [Pocillopora damicornis]